MPLDREPMPEALVGLIMVKLQLTYGRRFTGAYDADPAQVRAHWAHELAGMHPDGVHYALQHLPADYVPNVLQFRAIAANRPDKPANALPAPQVPPERVQRLLAPLKALRTTLQGPKDPLAWAERILKHPNGHSPCAISMAIDALRSKGRLP